MKMKPNKKSLIDAIEQSMIAELREEGPMSPAIVYDPSDGEFSFESALHGGLVVLDLQEGWQNAIYDTKESECRGMAEYLANDNWTEYLEKIEETMDDA